MNDLGRKQKEEPIIAVGLIQRAEALGITLTGYHWADGGPVADGGLRIASRAGQIEVADRRGATLHLTASDPRSSRFSIEATIGIDFHWQHRETQIFAGDLQILAEGSDRVTLINRVPLETYLTSVICSEMRADAPPESARAHAIISRSWLMAQLETRAAGEAPPPAAAAGEIITWTDRQAHSAFDVCADDHCQRYQGLGRITNAHVAAAIADTRGRVLTHSGRPCDARFSKCCGGVSEDFRSAWGEASRPYLVPVLDAAAGARPDLRDEATLRDYIAHPPPVFCNCADEAVLAQVLNDYDRRTADFFRWRVRVGAEEAGRFIAAKFGPDLGRVLALEPVERGPSGRLVRLRIRGERGELLLGKELAIRRALSDSHLYSSAFVIDPEGPAARPDAFVLSGAGWGHGVGLCQIGAAVMAAGGHTAEQILAHYYPDTRIERLYA